MSSATPGHEYIFLPPEDVIALVELGSERSEISLAGERCLVVAEHEERGFVYVRFPRLQIEDYPARPHELSPAPPSKGATADS